MTVNVTVSVQTRTVGMWRLVPVRLFRYIRPYRLAAWIICRWLNERVGVDVKVAGGKWTRTRFEVFTEWKE